MRITELTSLLHLHNDAVLRTEDKIRNQAHVFDFLAGLEGKIQEQFGQHNFFFHHSKLLTCQSPYKHKLYKHQLRVYFTTKATFNYYQCNFLALQKTERMHTDFFLSRFQGKISMAETRLDQEIAFHRDEGNT